MSEERKDAAHIFKRTIIGTDPNFQKEHEEKLASRVQNFEWDDSEETTEELPALTVKLEEVDECVALLLDRLFDGIITENFDGSDPSGMRFVISIDSEVHHLLKSRFDEKWSLDSRLEMFDTIRDHLATIFFADDEKKMELGQRIHEALPASHRKKFESDEVYLADDAMTVGDDSNMLSLEVPIHFVAN